MRVALVMIVLGLVLAAPARAEVIPVTTFDDPGTPGNCSLRKAIQAANTNAPGANACPAGDPTATDIVELPAGPYVLTEGAAGESANNTGDLDALSTGGPLVIQGAGAASTSISAAGIAGGDRVMDILAGATVTFGGVTLTGGAAPPGEDGGALRSAGTLTLVDVVVTGNRAGNGDQATLGSAATPGHNGGGIAHDGELTLRRSVVSDNFAGTGGRGFDEPGGPGRPGGNGGSGGGIRSDGILTIDHSLIVGNDAGAGGRGGDASIGNAGGDGGDGGGVAAGSALTMTSTLVTGNSGGVGGVGGDADSGQGGPGGNGGDGGGMSALASSVSFSTINANTVGGGGTGGLNVDQVTRERSGVAGIGSAIAGQVRLARTIAAGTCTGMNTDGGANLGGTGCPGSHAAPKLSATGVPLAASPAIDAAPVAGCPATDLAGRARPQGIGCDIGAFEAAAGTLAFSPTALTFRTTRVDGVRRRAVTVSNTGLAGLPVPTPTITSSRHFRLGKITCSATLLGLGSCSVRVRFTPKRKGARTGSLRIGTQVIALSGRAVLRCFVPKLKGKTLKKARKALRRNRCALGEVTRRGRGRPGRIRSSTPKARTVHPVGTAVDVVVNRRRR